MGAAITYCRPYTFLRCVKCENKTPHVMINVTNKPVGIKEGHECQECGRTKNIYELVQ